VSKEESKQTIQKFSWKNHKTFKTFEEANVERNNLLESDMKVKVKRCGPAGTVFVVKIGTPIKRKGEKNATK